MKNESGIALTALRSAALLAVVFGAVGSIGLLRHAQQHPPPLLAVLLVIWVFAPFGLLATATLVSKNCPTAVRKTLYVVTLAVMVASLPRATPEKMPVARLTVERPAVPLTLYHWVTAVAVASEVVLAVVDAS